MTDDLHAPGLREQPEVEGEDTPAAERFGKVQNVLVQVNLAREESKSGVYREDLDELLAAIDELCSVRLQGFMCIAPNYENVEQCRPLFREMYELFRQMKAAEPRTCLFDDLAAHRLRLRNLHAARTDHFKRKEQIQGGRNWLCVDFTRTSSYEIKSK